MPHLGVNPRGIKPNQLWQMDVTHIPEFGRLKFVHVSIDTFSGFMMATAQTGEATKNVISHCLHCFSAMGMPEIIKTDNGTGYTSKGFQQFCTQFSILHKTGIPYNPQGQGIIERAHGTLKTQIQKIKKGEVYPISPHTVLNHTLFILNFLNVDARGRSAADRFWHPSTQQDYAQVRWRDPLDNQWHGPDPVLIWGRGHVCVYSQSDGGARWLPERLVRFAADPAQSFNDPELS